MKRWMGHIACVIPAALAAVIGFRLMAVPHFPDDPPPQGVEALPGNQAVAARMETKHRLVEDVIAGRRTLFEAAAAFEALDAANPPYPGWVLPDPQPGVSRDEMYGRMVIDAVRGAAPPDRADKLVRRLEAELQERLENGPPLPAEPGGACTEKK